MYALLALKSAAYWHTVLHSIVVMSTDGELALIGRGPSCRWTTTPAVETHALLNLTVWENHTCIYFVLYALTLA